MAFRHPFTVTFSQVDSAGIVYFSRVFEIAHTAYEALLAEQGMALETILDRGEWVLPLVHAEADFVRPMRLGALFEVHLSIERIGTSTVTWRSEILDENEALYARVRTIHACVDLPEFKSREVPEALLAIFRSAGLLPNEAC